HPESQRASNLLIVTRTVPERGPVRDAVSVVPDVDYQGLVKAIDEMRAGNDANAMVLRVQRPSQPPEFATDRDGRLVALIPNFVLDVPAPPPQNRGRFGGPPALVYRLQSPTAPFLPPVAIAP